MALMAHEISSNKIHGVEASPAFDVAEKLRPHLANLMGAGGFRALLSRALILAKAEVSWLGKVQVDKDGKLEGLERTRFQLDQTVFLQGTATLIAQLLGLLAAFIGPTLTLQQINEVWPQFPLATWIVADDEVQDEKAN